MGLFDKQKPPQDETQQAAWLADRARIASFLYRARTFNGTGPEDPTLTVTLRPAERALLVATGTYLVDPRRVQAHWAGVSGGFSFHVPQQATQPEGSNVGTGGDLTPVDTGDLTFTDQRIVFAGARQSRDWEYSGLLGFHHADHPPWTAMAVSGQDRVSGFRYDEGQAGEIRFAIVLGLARFHNAVDSLIADLQEQLDEFDRAHSPAAVAAPTQTWQTPSSAPAQGVPMGAPGNLLGQPIPASTPGGTAGAPSAGAPWPPAIPFAAAPVGASPSPSASDPVTWNADPGRLAPTGAIGTNPTETLAETSSAETSTAERDQAAAAETDSSESGPPDTGPVGSGAVVTESAEHAPPSEPIVERAQPTSVDNAAVAEQPTAAVEIGIPTGEIPAVATSPTATYPAVAQQTPAGAQYQAGQPYQSGQAYQSARPYQAGQTYQSGQPTQQGQTQVQATTQATPSTPPGWYPDPWRVARVRWWDGYSWTSYTSH